MNIIQVASFGGTEVLRYVAADDPIASAGQVVVDVKAVGVNPVDVYKRAGQYATLPTLPYTPGMDCSGVISAVGEGVTAWNVGDRVYSTNTISGAYAEKTLCRAEDVQSLPDNIDFKAGAGVNVPYATSYRALFQRALLKPGESVLVHGASGGVGVAALQWARAFGCRVAGTASTNDGIELALRQGAHRVANHKEPNYRDRLTDFTQGRGFDVIVEMLANVNLQYDLEMLGPGGRVVVVGSRGETTVNPRALMGKDAAVLGMSLFNMGESDARVAYAAIGAGLSTGILRPIVGQTFALQSAGAAQDAVMAGGASGKVILIP